MGDVSVLWGKTDATGRPYPLIAHLIDAGMVARAIMRSRQYRRLVGLLSQQTGLGEESLDRLIPFLVALHDLGKASPGFQRKAPDLWPLVEASGFKDGHPLWRLKNASAGFRHDFEGFAVLREYVLPEWVVAGQGATRRHLTDALAQAIGAHHGSFVSESEAKEYPQVTLL